MAAIPHPRLRMRLTWAQRRAFVLTVVAYQAVVWSDVLLTGGRFGGNGRTAAAGAVFLLMAAATWWIGASLTRRGLVVHAVPPMVIPWESVHEIEVQHQFGNKVVVVHHTGSPGGGGLVRRTRLSAPTTGLLGRDADFTEKVQAMRTFWAAHRNLPAA